MKSLEEILKFGLQIRRTEELLLEAFKSGHIRGTVHTCLGQEIIPVMVNEYLGDAFWFSNHRGHGHYLARTGDFAGLFAEILSRNGGVSNGVGGSQHLHNDGFISNGIQGGQAGIAAGFSSPRNSFENKSVMFIGDGTLGVGHIYESWNIAAVENCSVLYIVEDNKIAQSTPAIRVFKGDLENRVIGFGLQYLNASDSNPDSLRIALDTAKLNLENRIPTVLQVETKRLGPHSKGDDNRDPNEIKALWESDLLSAAVREGIISYSDPSIQELEDLFESVMARKSAIYNKLSTTKPLWNSTSLNIKSFKNMQTQVNESLLRIASQNPNLIFIGEDISDDQFEAEMKYGGAFKVTSSLSSLYPSQVFSTPISESGLTGYGIGLALSGSPVIAEVMFGDFLTQNYDQIVHQLSKIPTMYGRIIPLPFILRTAVGGGQGYGPTHSGFMDNILVGLPNIVVVSINQFSNYYEILDWGLSQQSPMIILEPKKLYSQEVAPSIYSEYEVISNKSDGFHHLKPKRRNAQILILTHGGVSATVIDSLKTLAEEFEIFAEVFICEVINPANPDPLVDAIKRCNGKMVIVEESTGGSGAGSFFLSKLLAKGARVSLLHLYLDDWHPSGTLEDAILIDSPKLILKISDWLNKDE